MSTKRVTLNANGRRELINSLIDSAGSTFLAVEFVKKNGERRLMNVCYTPVEERSMFVPANARAVSKDGIIQMHHHPELRTVWDVTNDGFRNINLDTVVAVTTRGVRYELAA